MGLVGPCACSLYTTSISFTWSRLDRLDDGRERSTASLRRAFAASLSGTALEWYDFAAYSVAAATIFGTLFFPGGDQLTGTMAGVLHLRRRLSGPPTRRFVFGRLGDVIGRKRVLVCTLLLTGIATFLIGVLPTYADIGGFAAVLLVCSAFAQGVGIGGEWGGAVLLSSEFGDPRNAGSGPRPRRSARLPATCWPTACWRSWRRCSPSAVQLVGLAGRVPALRRADRLWPVDPR